MRPSGPTEQTGPENRRLIPSTLAVNHAPPVRSVVFLGWSDVLWDFLVAKVGESAILLTRVVG